VWKTTVLDRHQKYTYLFEFHVKRARVRVAVQFSSLSGFNSPPFRGSGRIMVRDRVRVRLGLRIGLELALGLGMDEPQCIILQNGGPRNGGPKSSKCCNFVVGYVYDVVVKSSRSFRCLISWWASCYYFVTNSNCVLCYNITADQYAEIWTDL